MMKSGPQESSGLTPGLLPVGLAFLAAGALVTAFALLFEVLGFADPVRAGRKALVPGFLAIWWLLVRPRRAAFGDLLGLRREPGLARTIATGFAAGALSLILLNALFLWLGARRFAWHEEAWKIPTAYVVTSLIGAIFESLIFRGLLHAAFVRTGGAFLALTAGPVLFSLTHFLRPTAESPAEGSLDAMTATLRGVATIVTQDRYFEFFGLVLVGLVLTLLRHRSGSTWLPLGVHWGWVWVQHSHRKCMALEEDVIAAREWWLGTQDNYDGVLGWIALSFALLLCFLPKKSMAQKEQIP